MLEKAKKVMLTTTSWTNKDYREQPLEERRFAKIRGVYNSAN